MIPESDNPEVLKAMVLGLSWSTCPDCGGPNQELLGVSRSHDLLPRACSRCVDHFWQSLREVGYWQYLQEGGNER